MAEVNLEQVAKVNLEMSKANLGLEVPTDVLQQARELFIEWSGYAAEPVAQSWLDLVRRGDSDDMPVLIMAQRSIMAERKRCAAVARRMEIAAGGGSMDPRDCKIASAIEAGESLTKVVKRSAR